MTGLDFRLKIPVPLIPTSSSQTGGERAKEELANPRLPGKRLSGKEMVVFCVCVKIYGSFDTLF